MFKNLLGCPWVVGLKHYFSQNFIPGYTQAYFWHVIWAFLRNGGPFISRPPSNCWSLSIFFKPDPLHHLNFLFCLLHLLPLLHLLFCLLPRLTAQYEPEPLTHTCVVVYSRTTGGGQGVQGDHAWYGCNMIYRVYSVLWNNLRNGIENYFRIFLKFNWFHRFEINWHGLTFGRNWPICLNTLF